MFRLANLTHLCSVIKHSNFRRLGLNWTNRNETGLELVLCLTNQTILFGYRTCPKSELFDNQTKPVLSDIRMFRFWTFTAFHKSTPLFDITHLKKVIISKSYCILFKLRPLGLQIQLSMIQNLILTNLDLFMITVDVRNQDILDSQLQTENIVQKQDEIVRFH